MPYIDPNKRYYVVDYAQAPVVQKRKSVNATPAIFLGNVLDTVLVGVFSYGFFLYIYPLDWLLPEFVALTLASIVFLLKDGPEYSTAFLSDLSDYAKDSLAPRVDVISRRGSPLGALTIGWYDLYDQIKGERSGQILNAVEPLLKKAIKYGFVLPTMVKVWDFLQKLKFSGALKKGRLMRAINKVIEKTQSNTIEEQNERILRSTYFDSDVRELVGHIAVFRETVDSLKAELFEERGEALKQATQSLDSSLDEKITQNIDVDEINRKINAFIKKGDLPGAIQHLAKKRVWLDNILNKAQRVKDGSYYPFEFLNSYQQEEEANVVEEGEAYEYARKRNVD